MSFSRQGARIVAIASQFPATGKRTRAFMRACRCEVPDVPTMLELALPVSLVAVQVDARYWPKADMARAACQLGTQEQA
jgi:hypothetical protein